MKNRYIINAELLSTNREYQLENEVLDLLSISSRDIAIILGELISCLDEGVPDFCDHTTYFDYIIDWRSGNIEVGNEKIKTRQLLEDYLDDWFEEGVEALPSWAQKIKRKK